MSNLRKQIEALPTGIPRITDDRGDLQEAWQQGWNAARQAVLDIIDAHDCGATGQTDELKAHLAGLLEAINADYPDIEYIHARARFLGLAIDQHRCINPDYWEVWDTKTANFIGGYPNREQALEMAQSDPDFVILSYIPHKGIPDRDRLTDVLQDTYTDDYDPAEWAEAIIAKLKELENEPSRSD